MTEYPWDAWARDLGYLDEEAMLSGLLQWGWTQARISLLLGVPLSTICKRLRALKLVPLRAAEVPRDELRRQARHQARIYHRK